MGNDEFNLHTLDIEFVSALDETYSAEDPGPKPGRQPSHTPKEVDAACVGVEREGVRRGELRTPHHVDSVSWSNEINKPVTPCIVDDRGWEVSHRRKMHRAPPDMDRPPVRQPARDNLECGRDLSPGVWNQDVELPQDLEERLQPARPMPEGSSTE